MRQSFHLLKRQSACAALGVTVLFQIALPPAAASAQTTCGLRARIVEVIEERYDEHQRLVALSAGGVVVEFFANAETGSWTYLVTRPDGVACVLAAGDAWDFVAEAPPAPKGQGS